MADTDSMTVPQFVAHLATVDDAAELARMRTAEEDGQKRKGIFEAIDARAAELEGTTEAFDTYQLASSTTYVVAHPDGEVTFTTEEDGSYTPTSEREAWALNELGVKPGRE